MGFFYWASTCEYARFQKDVLPLLRKMRTGNFQALREQALRSVTHILGRYPRSPDAVTEYSDGQWHKLFLAQSPASFHGYGVSSVKQVEAIEEFTPYESACLLLNILDEYLTMAPSPGANYGIVTMVLPKVGWNDTEVEFFRTGRPMPTLLSDTSETQGLEKIAELFDYRRPYAGWFTWEEMCHFHAKLVEVEMAIRDFDLQVLPSSRWFDLDNPVVVKEYQRGLIRGYWDAIKMTKMAVDLKEGLVFTNNL